MTEMAEKKEWIDWQNTKVLQKAAVVDEEGNVLVIRRAETGYASRPGKWDLPGGSLGLEDLVKVTKPNVEAIKREVREETGLNAVNVKSVFVDSWVFTKSPGDILGLAIGYKVKVPGVKPNVVLSDEHIESKWVTKEEAANSDFGEDGGLHKSIVQEV